MKLRFLQSFLFVLACTAAFSQKSPTKTQEKSDIQDYFKPLKYRCIGPFRGGRSVCATGIIGDPMTYYMGSTGGGVWKTEDAGQYWNNISDGFFKTGSVGAIECSRSNPNIIYVGMGEHAPRGVMTSHGDGVYKSTDAGRTWKHLGLEETQHISRIAIHPENPDIVYVAAQGQLYGPNEERGIFKSIDGGKTWKKVLYVNDLTGAAELSMDWSDPNILYAAMWEHQRLPWKVISGGDGSGLYKSMDAGETWVEMKEGLPDEKGKMAISVCQSNTQKVYAVIESDSHQEKGGLFVSHNGGKSWSRVSSDHRLVQRAWYYTEVFADPTNDNVVYVLSAAALKSIDGGKTWSLITGTHGDYHNLWINPDNPNNLCIANDGGAAISFNTGGTWSTQDNMPTAQIYRVNVDNGFPYRIYGGQQDNTSVSIAHREFGSSSIGKNSWTYSAGGESAFLAFDPDNPRYVLGGSYLGTIEVLDNKASAGTNIMAAPILYMGNDAKDMKYRFNWNAPIIWSQWEPNTYYHGSQILLKTSDTGQTWKEVSPDLTRNRIETQGKGGGPYTNEAVGAENYGTISYIIESPHEAGVIWVGTDDGLVQLTKDGGKSWNNVTPKGLEECLINAIEISPHDPATAYIATTRYKFNDHTPRLLKTTNYGLTWKEITGNIPKGAYTRVVREDDVRKDLLFAGTETGIYISWNGGAKWELFNLNLPVTPILDIKIKHDDLIIGTSGRSFWILDDMGLLRQYQESADNLQIYQPEDAVIANGSSQLNGNKEEFDGTEPTTGVNPANGVVIYYQLPQNMDSTEIVLNVYNAHDELVNSFTSSKSKSPSYDGGPPSSLKLSTKKGLNRFVWDMRHATLIGVPNVYIEGSYRGHKASPGAYKLKLKVDEKEVHSSCVILNNPLYDLSNEDYNKYHNFMKIAENDLNAMHEMVNDLFEIRNKLQDISDKIDSVAHKELKQKSLALITKMKTWDEEMVQRKSKAYDDVENFQNKFTANYLYALNHGESDIPRINQPTIDRINELNITWTLLKKRGEDLLNLEIPDMNEKLWKAQIGALWIGK